MLVLVQSGMGLWDVQSTDLHLSWGHKAKNLRTAYRTSATEVGWTLIHLEVSHLWAYQIDGVNHFDLLSEELSQFFETNMAYLVGTTPQFVKIILVQI